MALLLAFPLVLVACGAADKEVKVVEVEKKVVVEVIKEVPVIEQVVVTKEVIKEVIVEKPVVVTKEVIKEVVVEKPIIVIKEVVQTVEKPVVVIERIIETVVVEAGMEFADLPKSKNPRGTVVMAGGAGEERGLNTIFGGPYAEQGIGEDLFAWRYRQDGSIDYESPVLAVGWDIASDLSKVSLSTRQGVVFHKRKGYDVGLMTAEDVAWSYNQANPAVTENSVCISCGNLASLFGAIPAKAIGPNTVEFSFAAYDVEWMGQIANANARVGVAILSKKLYEMIGEDGVRNFNIGTGPLKIDSWTPDERFVLVPHLEHWGVTAAFNRLISVNMPEEIVRVASLKAGEVDIISTALTSAPALVADGFKTVGNGNASEEGLIFNGNYWEDKHAITGEPLEGGDNPAYKTDVAWAGNPFQPDDPDNPPGMDDMEQARLVRWALAMAVDRDKINETLLGGLGWPVYTTYLSIKSSFFRDEWIVPHDLKKANEYLDQAGYKRGADGKRPFKAQLYRGAEAGTAIAGWWREHLGVDTEIIQMSYSVMRPSLVNRTNTWIIIMDGDDGQSIYPHSKPKGLVNSSLTRGGYCVCWESPVIAQLYLKAATEPDLAKRQAVADEFIEYIHHWALQPGVWALPQLQIINPRTIEEWKVPPSAMGFGGWWRITPN